MNILSVPRRTLQQLHSMRRFSHTANPLPATFLRGGTSKGIFLRCEDLPEDPKEWTPIFQGIMGSPDPEYCRQLNGMGGGVSSLSKICVVGPPTTAAAGAGADVEYTFVQIGIGDGSLDLSGNCGNLSSMIGVYALDEGLCTPSTYDQANGLATVRSWNTNTSKLIDTTFPLSSDRVPDLNRHEVEMAGVPGKASRIVLQFVNPGGARTGKLLPTGSPVDSITIGDKNTHTFSVSLVDATNPTVFILASDLANALGMEAQSLTAKHYTDPAVEDMLERVRRAGAVRMGLDPEAKAQPKIAVLSEPISPEEAEPSVDVVIHAFSMGVLHKAVPMTVGLCLGVAAGVEGTIAHAIVTRIRSNRDTEDHNDMVRIRHPGGTVDVGAKFDSHGNVLNAQVVRTGRRLMKGAVWW